MKQKTIDLYTYDELPKDIQEKVLDKYRDFNTEHNWYQWTIDDFIRELQKAGYEDAETYFTGFWSQGDGASFTARVNLPVWCKAHKKYKKYAKKIQDADATARITKSGMYEHEYTMRIESDNIPDNMLDIEDAILEDARELARGLYKTLRKEYEYLTSDESVKESLLANEYTFRADGRMENL